MAASKLQGQRTPSLSQRQRTEEDAAKRLYEAVMGARLDAAKGVVYSLFKPELGGKTARLRGPGGSRGVITVEALEKTVEAAVTAGLGSVEHGLPPEEEEQRGG